MFCFPHTQGKSSGLFKVSSQFYSDESFQGKVLLQGKLDYEKQNLHFIQICALVSTVPSTIISFFPFLTKCKGGSFLVSIFGVNVALWRSTHIGKWSVSWNGLAESEALKFTQNKRVPWLLVSNFFIVSRKYIHPNKKNTTLRQEGALMNVFSLCSHVTRLQPSASRGRWGCVSGLFLFCALMSTHYTPQKTPYHEYRVHLSCGKNVQLSASVG